MFLRLLTRATRSGSRSLATISPQQTQPYQIFDRAAKVLQKDRAASYENGERSVTVDYLRNEVAERMMERLDDIKRKFDTLLDLGAGAGHFAKLLEKDKVRQCIMVDSSGTRHVTSNYFTSHCLQRKC
jgi:NADH dehydrogenase [ubiquinone] 1 alpha subcomplex assembly factor 5